MYLYIHKIFHALQEQTAGTRPQGAMKSRACWGPLGVRVGDTAQFLNPDHDILMIGTSSSSVAIIFWHAAGGGPLQ
jgi:hypothetical protein